jgi:hypothetical protein
VAAVLSVHHASTAVFNAVLSANGRQPGYGASEPDDEANMFVVVGLLARFQQRDWSNTDALSNIALYADTQHTEGGR